MSNMLAPLGDKQARICEFAAAADGGQLHGRNLRRLGCEERIIVDGQSIRLRAPDRVQRGAELGCRADPILVEGDIAAELVGCRAHEHQLGATYRVERVS